MITHNLSKQAVASDLAKRFNEVRRLFLALVEPLKADDFNGQTMADVSPPKWHLAHTTWFFETFILKPFVKDYRVYHPQFEYLFNSYYNSVGKQYPRPHRGQMIRPTTDEVFAYRRYVDEQVNNFLNGTVDRAAFDLIDLGIHHEQQHQELFLTDIKHVYGQNPLFPAYKKREAFSRVKHEPMVFLPVAGGTVTIGHTGDGFCFDNEKPQHQCLIHAFNIANRAVTNSEYGEFIDAGGYQKPELWLADGWAFISAEKINKPLYWHNIDQAWFEFTLAGLQPLQPDCPVTHVSFYEADAYARWRGKSLPSEAQWEHVAAKQKLAGNLLETGHYHPCPNNGNPAHSQTPAQMIGDVWEWTSSPYCAYPGYRPTAGAVGEYNGKFMCNQMVLRGGSCVTANSHIRCTYRNFFYPSARWQFSGIRLVESW